MSRTDLDYASLRDDLRAASDVELATEFITATSEAHVRHLRSLYVMSTSERRDNLLSLAEAVLAARAPQRLTQHLADSVAYYATCPEPMPAFGRLLWAVRECDAEETDKALDRLVAA